LTVVKYIFYKSAVLVLPQFFFGIESLFSGQPIYQDIMYQLANVAFTAFPIIALGVFDRDVPVKQAMATPGLYKDGIERRFLNRKVFWGWMLEAILHAVLIVFLPMLALGYFNVLPTAESVSIWELGTIVFLSFLTVVSLRLATEVLEWQVLITVLIIASLVVWWLAWAVLNFMLAVAPTIYGSFLVFPGSGRFWFVYLLSIMACFVTIFAVEGVSVIFYPSRSQVVRERLAGLRVEKEGGAAAAGEASSSSSSSSSSNGNGYVAVVVPLEQEQEEGRVGVTKVA
jgi:magnesium-transporting ATPase (P-type)